MIKFDLFEYATEKWNNYRTTMREVSKSYGTVPLLNSDQIVYNFDKITGDIFQGCGNIPSSADCIFLHDNDIDVIEFKKGFHSAEAVRKMTPRTGECPDCEASKQKELKTRVCIKAIESYITLCKQIFPTCNSSEFCIYNLNYKLIIDGEPLDDMMDIYSDITKGKKCRLRECDKPLIREIKQVLNGLTGYVDKYGNKYYYDNALVHTNYQYLHLLTLI